ncbi:MAG: hypothetical protein IKT42_06445 [Clostridia bacterium]|nr:hypothetical protein [Clostridia bacterium]
MAKRIYTEEYIAAIAGAIRAKNDTSNKYKVSEMAGAIMELTGLKDFIKNNMLSLKRVLYYTTESQASGIIFYNDATHFYCLPSNDKVNAGLIFNFSNGAFHPQQIQFMQDDTVATGMCAPDENQYLLTGIENYYPLMSNDVTAFNRTGHAKLRFGDSYNANLLNFPVQLLQMDENLTHPLILQAYANENTMSFSDFISNYQAGLFDIINTGFVPPENYGNIVPITKGYIYVTPDDRLIIQVFIDVSGWEGELMFDGTKLVATNWFHWQTIALDYYFVHNKFNVSLSQSSSPGGSVFDQFTSAELIQQRFIYATSDIKDANDNIIFPANISLAEFSSWIDYPTT